MAVAHVNQIGTAIPEHDVHEPSTAFMRTLLPDARTRRVFDRMAKRSGIAHRYSFMQPARQPEDEKVDADGFYRRHEFPGTQARMAVYETQSIRLALQAVAALQRDISFGGLEHITHLVVASCTGFTAPGLDLQLADALSLKPDVQRTLIGFMGCSAAVPALRAATQAVRSDPAARVLVVNLELCSLHLQDTDDLERLLSLLLFSDGASAALVTSEPAGITLLDFLAMIIPDSQDLITWKIGDQGFDMYLSGQVPRCITGALGEQRRLTDERSLLRGAPIEDIDLWAVHGGGRSVLDAVQSGLRLEPEALKFSRAVLHDYGNMSSATVMFVLERMLREGRAGQLGMAMAFGPGMVAETFRFRMTG